MSDRVLQSDAAVLGTRAEHTTEIHRHRRSTPGGDNAALRLLKIVVSSFTYFPCPSLIGVFQIRPERVQSIGVCSDGQADHLQYQTGQIITVLQKR